MKKRKRRAKKTRFSLEDIDLNAEFLKAIELIENTERCVFLTGKAGTGKTTLLRYFKGKTKKNIVVLASTGIAAINIGGQTIHSFFMLPPRFIQKDDVRLSHKNQKIIQSLDTLVIDEVSMVRADVMDAIDYSLRVHRKRLGVPFGGVQVVLFGDLHQLSPVIEPTLREVYKTKYASPYFFHADVFREVILERIELSKVYRQTEREFVEILNRIRDKNHTAEDLGILNQRVTQKEVKGSHIILTTTNRDAAAINEAKLAALPGEAFVYGAEVSGKFEESAFPSDNRLVLKKGAQVMLTKNDVEFRRWVNGSIGIVEDLSEEEITVSIDGKKHEIPMASWDKHEYVLNEETGEIEQDVVGTFRQYPIRLAWAITIHKSQGQTFDRVIIDTGNGVFAHGQLYVALSRCTRLEGIQLKRSIVHSDVKFDENVLNFGGFDRQHTPF